MKSFLCRYDHVSMSWTNLNSFKVLAPIIEVDKHHSFLDMCTVPGVPPNVAW
jgi:hypothetical protein